jgi:hypothetical protein
LELRFLHVCEALATYPQKTIQQTDEIVGASALAAGGAGDDDDDDDHANEGGGVEGGAGGDGDGEGEGEGDGGGVPKSVSPSANIHDFLHWNVHGSDIPFKEMGYCVTPKETLELKSFHAACILFFFDNKLPQMYSDVNNALHAAWTIKFSEPMKAETLRNPPMDYTAEEKNWCIETIDFMERKLSDDERAARGLPLQPISRPRRAVVLHQPTVLSEVDVDENDDDLIDERYSQQFMLACYAPAFCNLISMFSGAGAGAGPGQHLLPSVRGFGS